MSKLRINKISDTNFYIRITEPYDISSNMKYIKKFFQFKRYARIYVDNFIVTNNEDNRIYILEVLDGIINFSNVKYVPVTEYKNFDSVNESVNLTLKFQ